MHLDGGSNVQNVSLTREVTVLGSTDGAQTNAVLVAGVANKRIAVSRIHPSIQGSGDCSVRVGFGASTLPAAALVGVAGIVYAAQLSATRPAVPSGDGHHVIGIGGVGESLLFTCTDPGAADTEILKLIVTYKIMG
jgi:hypothetical protein